MKFMVSCRQPLVILKNAEEIRVNYEDIARLKDLVTDDWVCSAEIVIYISEHQMINWNEIDIYKDVLNIVIAVEDTKQISVIKSKGYKVFWSYPASIYTELRSLIYLGVDEVLLDGPLYFDLPRVKSICGDNIEIRLVVNKCYNNNLPLENGICGTYIRPEDIEIYSRFVDHFEFDSNNSLKKEHTLYTIYKQDKKWLGNLNILLTNLNVDVDNRGFEVIPTEEEPEDKTEIQDNKNFALRRIQCGQACQSTSPCRLCQKYFDLIDIIQKWAEKTQQDETTTNK